MMMMKPWQAPSNKAPGKGGNEEQRERGPKSKPEEQSPKWVQRGIGSNYVLAPPLKYYWPLCSMGTFT